MLSVLPEARDVEFARAALRVLAGAAHPGADAHTPVTLTLSESGEEVIVPNIVLDPLGGALANVAKGDGDGFTLVPANLGLSWRGGLIPVS
ncbi:hypothetical protein [Sanguibacter antarcticus]|uniref:Uncharacterized protein n=1 Tax=Sanguibacter antarcticus TaxID=372484 RepID=A0A2A9E615_9MICO|nr:hypothetical protein [Sanguibacter antarcticus]PFG33795.1 hypothetical protein ATL42_1687 [Sanguibacter antarcticus]